MSAFALISIALQHPDAAVLEARGEVAAAARSLPRSPGHDALRDALDWWAREPADDLRRRYVETFDFSRRTALDLTYYTHGDRRQRGLALLALRRRYDAAGPRPRRDRSCPTTSRWCWSSPPSIPPPAASCWPSSGP